MYTVLFIKFLIIAAAICGGLYVASVALQDVADYDEDRWPTDLFI